MAELKTFEEVESFSRRYSNNKSITVTLDTDEWVVFMEKFLDKFPFGPDKDDIEAIEDRMNFLIPRTGARAILILNKTQVVLEYIEKTR